MSDGSKLLMQENFCDECDDVLHAVVDEKKFWGFKVGRIRCACGCVVLPCNECFGSDYHGECGNCPWKNAEIQNAMTDEEYVSWAKKNDSALFDLLIDGSAGDYYRGIAEKISK